MKTGKEQHEQGRGEDRGTKAFLEALDYADRQVIERRLDQLDAAKTSRSRKKTLTALAEVYVTGLKHGADLTKQGKEATTDFIHRMTNQLFKLMK